MVEEVETAPALTSRSSAVVCRVLTEMRTGLGFHSVATHRQPGE